MILSIKCVYFVTSNRRENFVSDHFHKHMTGFLLHLREKLGIFSVTFTWCYNSFVSFINSCHFVQNAAQLVLWCCISSTGIWAYFIVSSSLSFQSQNRPWVILIVYFFKKIKWRKMLKTRFKKYRNLSKKYNFYWSTMNIYHNGKGFIIHCK